MKVKDIIKNALVLVGREDVLKSMKMVEENVDSRQLTSEESETVDTLLYCFNAVEDELARCYFPLTKKEVLKSENGVYAFSEFASRPIKIISVKADGKEIKFESDALGLNARTGEITVTYRYVPAKKTIEDICEYGEERMGERLLAAGTASEYCLICGEASMAQSWESVYRGEIDRLQRRCLSELQLPPRRWV